MRKGKSGIGFVLVTICLVFISAFCITGTVRSQSKPEPSELENYYRARERELVQNTRDYLNQAGFRNSGVTLTKVMEGDGSRNYTVTIHHDRIDRMDSASRESLKEELAALTFAAENCTFYHEFLVTDL